MPTETGYAESNSPSLYMLPDTEAEKVIGRGGPRAVLIFLDQQMKLLSLIRAARAYMPAEAICKALLGGAPDADPS